MSKYTKFIWNYKVYIALLLIVLSGLYLRFWDFNNNIGFGWDQTRDAWKTRDILMGQVVLNGPRTGVGHFYLGPLWYYLLAPFYFITKLDRVGAIYLNIFVNIFNFGAFFWVTKKIYNDYAALFAVIILATSKYLISITQTPWNVSPLFGFSALIFYSIYKVVYKNDYKFIPVLAFLTGLFFHLHFAVIFLIPIILLSFVFVQHKMKALIIGIKSLPLFLIWLLPIVIFDLQTKNSNTNLFSSFLKDYYVGGFHLQFFLHRLHDAFIQFQTVLAFPPKQTMLKFLIPIVFLIFAIFEKNKKERLLNYLVSLWFIVPSILYALYGGSTSEYYVLLNAPLVIYILIYLQKKILLVKFKYVLIPFLLAIWGFYIFYNTHDLWVKSSYGGLHKDKDVTVTLMNTGMKLGYNEGDIHSYLRQIWSDAKKKK